MRSARAHQLLRATRPLRSSLQGYNGSSRAQFRPIRWCSCNAEPLSESSRSLPKTTKNPATPPADHRALAVNQELFTTSTFSPGSPLLLPNGAYIFNELTSFLRAQYKRFGFQEVITPTIYKKSLWEQSGHWENYKDDMFSAIGRSGLGEPKDKELGEDEEYGLKPMNCPGHCLLFKSKIRSYRNLPIRYADFSPLHRNEVSGALSGLTRVRRFHQDDGHIFCTPSQVEDEISSTLDFVGLVYNTFNLPPFKLVLSTRPEKDFIGTAEEWERAEKSLKGALDRSGRDWTLNKGDGAFYGPKIDIILKDSDGKEHQTATIQLDFQLPQRFGLSYIAPPPESTDSPADADARNSAKATPVIIHRAIFGSLERFMALLIEHYDRKWPFWLNPKQAVILTVGRKSHKMLEFLNIIRGLQVAEGDDGQPSAMKPLPRERQTFLVDFDESSQSLGKKLVHSHEKGYSVIISLGPKEVEKGYLTVDIRSQRDLDWSKQVLSDMVGSDAVGDGRAVKLSPEQTYQYFCSVSSGYR
ncbi:MAG: protein transporter tim10 [Chaenotheca gracillima]|nr:MAG: protein transporter tim10 [Chaenotheca gracillima]